VSLPDLPVPVKGAPYRNVRSAKAFNAAELHALVFRLNIAETVEPLDEFSSELREKMIDELRERNAKLRPSDDSPA
jgi:hypothetical protein